MHNVRVSLERSLAVLRWYVPLSRLYFWAPVFFLYFVSLLPVTEVLELHALYYAVVVLLEVPSGYLSDRVGRRATLLISAVAMGASYALFLLGQDFATFALAQVLLAAGFACLSGSDTSLHFDTLQALGRSDEFAQQQAGWSRNGYLAASAGALLGGAVAVVDLRLAYALSLANAVVLVGLVLAMREPPRGVEGWAGRGFASQLGQCVAQLRRPLLAWIFAYVILKVTLEHVPYEFQQPYLANVLDEPPTQVLYAPLAAGLVTCVLSFVGAFAAARSIRLRERLGLGGSLLSLAALQSGLIALMALVIHPLVVPLLALRNVQTAAATVIVNTEIAPRVPQAQRATYLSLHSLAGRLGYAGVLYGLSILAGDRSIDEPAALTSMLEACALVAFAGLAVLALSRRALERDRGPLSGAGPTS